MKKHIPLLILTLFPLLLVGQECISGNCVNGQGTMTTPDGESYVGEFKDGMICGRGTFTLQLGHKHVGEFENNKFTRGTIIQPDGTSSPSSSSPVLDRSKGSTTPPLTSLLLHY